jgi:Caspase domain
MSAFSSSLLRAALLTGFLSLLHGAAFAQDAGAQSPVQPPPQSAAVDTGPPSALPGPEQRVALVMGNSHYQNAPELPNPDHDAQSVAEFLNSAGFEVVEATDLTQNDMIKVVQDFSARVTAHGPNTVAMIYYAGHGVQMAGENYLVPIDAKVSSPGDIAGNSLRLVDVMATLERLPSRMRIVMLDACRNNPFPATDDAGRGLAIVDAPNGSIVGYSTAPGAEALDGNNGHSPYTNAFLNLARQPNVPIEQLFKRVRLEVNHATSGQQTPWESSSLISDFTFFGDTAVAAIRAPANEPVVQMASNLPSRAARQAYDFVVSEGKASYYQEFLDHYPHDPLCDNIRVLLANLLEAEAWHNAVLQNSPLAYKAFYEKHPTSPYVISAIKLASQPKIVPLMQATHLWTQKNPVPMMKATNIVTLPSPGNKGLPAGTVGKIVNLPVQNKIGTTPLQGKTETIHEPTTIKKDIRMDERKDVVTGSRKFKAGPTLEKRPTFNKPAGGFGRTRFAMGGGGGGFGRGGFGFHR